jgi:RNA polymerase sigma factor (sigma-70 family)
MPIDSLHALLRASIDGSSIASSRLMWLATDVIRRSLRGWAGAIISDRGLLEDVTQEAALRVWVHRLRCRATTDDQVAAWMAAIGRMAAIDLLRASGPRHAVWLTSDILGDMAAPDEEERVDPVAATLAELSWSLGSDASELLWCRLVLEQSWKEIGHAHGVSWTTARRRFQRAAARLRVLALRDSHHSFARQLLARLGRASVE